MVSLRSLVSTYWIPTSIISKYTFFAVFFSNVRREHNAITMHSKHTRTRTRNCTQTHKHTIKRNHGDQTRPTQPRLALRSQLWSAYQTSTGRRRGHARRVYSAAAAVQCSTEALKPKTMKGEFLPSPQPKVRHEFDVCLSFFIRRRPLTPRPRRRQQHCAMLASGRVRSCQNQARAKFRNFEPAGVHKVSMSNALLIVFLPK